MTQLGIKLKVQGDHSGCGKPPVDIDVKVAVSVKGPYTKTQLSYLCQQEVLHNLNGHPVDCLLIA